MAVASARDPEPALLVAILGCSGCGSAAGYEYGSPASRDGATLGAFFAGVGGDCRGAAVLEHYAETGDVGIDIIPAR